MTGKRILTAALALLLLLILPVSALAAEEEKTFSFELTVDGRDTKEVEEGDIITVVLKLKRTDSAEAYTMYAMQDEIRYDSRVFELVEGSTMLGKSIATTDISAEGDYREVYLNFLSTGGGNQWDADTLVGSFQLRVTGTTGISTITNEDYLVSLQDGSGSYPCTAQDLTIVLSGACVVRFAANGGSALPDQTAEFGKLLMQPADPVRAGYRLEGWYSDAELTRKWDFTRDTVPGDLTLYAKWEPIAAEKQGFSPVWLLIPAAAAAAVVLARKKKSGKNPEQT